MTHAPLEHVPGHRPELPAEVVARIRAERRRPRMTRWDGAHLQTIRQGVAAAVRRLPPRVGPALDVWCGAKPYDVLLGGEVVGLDIDRHFGGADVLAVPPFPFRDGAFEVVMCSQALHIVPEPERTVAELRRVVKPGGHVLVTVPGLMLRAGPSSFEGRHTPAELAARFAGWDDVRVHRAGGPGAALTHAVGMVLDAIRRRVGLPEALLRPAYTVVNIVGSGVDLLLGPLGRRWPHTLILTARRPVG
jgi:SAM-dependent methyltransferase